jgi:heme A synthase
MKLNKRWLIVYIIALLTLTFVQGAYGGIQVTASGSASGESGFISIIVPNSTFLN